MAKKPAIVVDPSVIAQAQGAVGTSGAPQGKAWLTAPIDNSKLNLKDATGKLLPATITGAQFQQALTNTKYNYGQVEAIKAAAAGLPGYAGIMGTKVSATGQITPAEINAISSIVETGFLNNAVGTKLDVSNIFAGIKDGSLTANNNATPWTLPSTISRTTFDQPNIEASKNTINTVFMDLLGREANQQEVQKYTTQYLQYAAKNPVDKTTGQNQYSNIQVPTASGGTSNRLFRGSQTETGVQNNLTETAFLNNQVRASGEFNAVQAGGTAFDLMKKIAAENTGTL
jgi:hypothetical protein